MNEKIKGLVVVAAAIAGTLLFLSYVYETQTGLGFAHTMVKLEDHPFLVVERLFWVGCVTLLGMCAVGGVATATSRWGKSESPDDPPGRVIYMYGDLERSFLLSFFRQVEYQHGGAKADDIFPGVHYMMLSSTNEFEAALVYEGAGQGKQGTRRCIGHVVPEKNGDQWQAVIAVHLGRTARTFTFVMVGSNGGGQVTLRKFPSVRTVVAASNLGWWSYYKVCRHVKKNRGSVIGEAYRVRAT